MKKPIVFLIFFLVFANCFSQNKFENPEVDPILVQKNYESWSAYNKTIMLSRDFTPFSADSKEITKVEFLNALVNGNFIPVRLKTQDSVYKYKLVKILPKSDTSIKAAINQEAFDALKNYEMEGKPFPQFSFKDLDGNEVSNETMKGKIIVIKCWYIHCAACIKEFPAVNALVSKYKDRNDIVFVSLAEDTPEQLKTFLARKPLSYSVIPNMKEYMNNTLQLNAFPTHFIINKEGKIAKVLNNYESLEVALEKVAGI
ncbi:TlpA family protein disulfide reductase [Flavobacterium hungaricum]|uniref:TlpA family protein disulfide reductase n=1 Tax=Flavobacterium hungaricum TaxID=2082725 RepID=A0ABR9TMF1_9FLAO|nr:redoxin domain-containing protein [Flavobacterium hungaricum]MBE8726536.1 TlpA family protein disulfide reductase [Flavobacterium hungaricum]